MTTSITHKEHLEYIFNGTRKYQECERELRIFIQFHQHRTLSVTVKTTNDLKKFHQINTILFETAGVASENETENKYSQSQFLKGNVTENLRLDYTHKKR